MEGKRELRGSRDLSKLPAKGKRSADDLPKEIQVQVKAVAAAVGKGAARSDDNSNTQFAMLALWAARRHDVPVEVALGLVEQRFRATQHPIIRSYEPGEEWFWCYPDELMFELRTAGPALHHS